MHRVVLNVYILLYNTILLLGAPKSEILVIGIAAGDINIHICK